LNGYWLTFVSTSETEHVAHGVVLHHIVEKVLRNPLGTQGIARQKYCWGNLPNFGTYVSSHAINVPNLDAGGANKF
jgi:hypothetical protein